VKPPRTAMVLAAGLGLRMRPLTADRPKALVEVAGKPLIDHMLDRLAGVGVTRAIVNVHAFADLLEAHLKLRADMEIIVSDERERLLETGGALKKVRPLLGDEPIFVANIDSVWIEGATAALPALIGAWNAAVMDDLLLLVPLERSTGFDGAGDFFRDDAGRLAHRGGAPAAPLAYIGVQMLAPAIIDAWPDGPQPLFPHWMELQARGRLHGVVMDGRWMHVGDPAARAAAQAALAGR
jgi:N-acetyl-alpha-D-muramate 1-phosphate uridylyltransferase